MSPADSLQRINTSRIYPPFLVRVLRMLDALQLEGLAYVATLGFRTFAEQAALYFQGRTNLSGPIVTDAMAGQSAHNYGLALDFVRMVGITPSWRPEDYEDLGEAAEAVGLVWGGRWDTFPDRPHVQWPGFVKAQQLEPLLRLHGATPAGHDYLPACWAHVTSESPTQPEVALVTPPPKPPQ